MNMVPMTWHNSWSEGVHHLGLKVKGWWNRLWGKKEEITPNKWMPRRRNRGQFWGISHFLDMEETADEVIVHTQMPKLDKNDFSVNVSMNQLIIRGEKQFQSEEKRRNYYRMEWAYGRIARSIPLPCEVKADEARAEYKNGMLTVHLPKADSAKHHRIPVHID